MLEHHHRHPPMLKLWLQKRILLLPVNILLERTTCIVKRWNSWAEKKKSTCHLWQDRKRLLAFRKQKREQAKMKMSSHDSDSLVKLISKPLYLAGLFVIKRFNSDNSSLNSVHTNKLILMTISANASDSRWLCRKIHSNYRCATKHALC